MTLKRHKKVVYIRAKTFHRNGIGDVYMFIPFGIYFYSEIITLKLYLLIVFGRSGPAEQGEDTTLTYFHLIKLGQRVGKHVYTSSGHRATLALVIVTFLST